MARILGNAVNELKLFDNISNSEIVLYYTTPTTKEREGYQNKAVRRRRNKITTHLAEARLEYGMKILSGFRDGDFMRLDAEGTPKKMSSDPGSADFHSGWKDEVRAHGADLVMTLAGHVFDTPAEVDEQDEVEPGEPAEGK